MKSNTTAGRLYAGQHATLNNLRFGAHSAVHIVAAVERRGQTRRKLRGGR